MIWRGGEAGAVLAKPYDGLALLLRNILCFSEGLGRLLFAFILRS